MNNFFLDKLIANMHNKPDTIAIKDSEGELTYRMLGILTDSLAASISEVTLGRNVPIVIYNKRGVEFVICMLAVLKVGAFYIPIEKPIAPDRLDYICRQTVPALIITDEPIDTFEYKQIYFKRSEYTERDSIACKQKHEYRRDDLAYVMFTSGTTGTPKGVKISYGNLNNLVNSFWEILYKEFETTVSVGVMSSFGFDASVKMIFPALVYGHTLVIAHKSVINFGRKIHYFHADNNIQVSDGTPSHLKLMTLQKTKVYSTASHFLIGGENLEYNTVREFCRYLGRVPVIINVYGPTECCVDISYRRIAKDEIDCKEGSVPIGNPLPGNYLEIHSENGLIITEGHKKGELWIRGNQVGMGYYDGENRGYVYIDDTSERLYKTGDIVMYNDNNEIIVMGRIDRQVKIHGNRVELDEIAMVLRNLDGISDADVLWTTLHGKDSLVAFVVTENATPDVSYWNRQLMKKLPQYMLITKYVIVDRIPLNLRGKTDREALLRLLQIKDN